MASRSHRYVTVKRKATDEPSTDLKRCKFVGSCDTGEVAAVTKFLLTTTPLLADKPLEITDYDMFILQEKRSSFPKPNEVISCNGQPLIATDVNVASDDEDEAHYVYDVYLYDAVENEEEALVEEKYQEHDDDDQCSSNDEDHPYNDYPDEDEHDFNQTDFYRDWEDDECRDMVREFERNRIRADSASENDDDEF